MVAKIRYPNANIAGYQDFPVIGRLVICTWLYRFCLYRFDRFGVVSVGYTGTDIDKPISEFTAIPVFLLDPFLSDLVTRQNGRCLYTTLRLIYNLCNNFLSSITLTFLTFVPAYFFKVSNNNSQGEILFVLTNV